MTISVATSIFSPVAVTSPPDSWNGQPRGHGARAGHDAVQAAPREAPAAPLAAGSVQTAAARAAAAPSAAVSVQCPSDRATLCGRRAHRRRCPEPRSACPAAGSKCDRACPRYNELRLARMSVAQNTAHRSRRSTHRSLITSPDQTRFSMYCKFSFA